MLLLYKYFQNLVGILLSLQGFLQKCCKSFLSLASNTNLSVPIVLRTISSLPSLVCLDLTSTFYLSDTDIQTVLKAAKNLRYLNLTDCRRLTPAAINSLIQYGKSLHHIDIGGCMNINQNLTAIVTLLKEHPNVPAFTGLGLSGVPLLSNEVFELIAKRCKSLVRIALGHQLIGDDFIVPILLASSSSLEIVQLHWCANIDYRTVQVICQSLPRLFILDMTGAKNVTQENIVQILSNHERSIPEYLHPKPPQVPPRLNYSDWQMYYANIEARHVKDMSALPSVLSDVNQAKGLAYLFAGFTDVVITGTALSLRDHVERNKICVNLHV